MNTPISRRSIAALAIAGLLVVFLAGAELVNSLTRYPKRFGEVVPGRLYRSGEISSAQLETLKQERGLQRVICFLNPDVPETQAERTAAEQLGILWENVPLPGNGASAPDDRRRILELLRDTSAGPTLVHCAAGSSRTGLAVGLYRIVEQGWPLEKTMNELRVFGFEDGPNHENLRAALKEAAERRTGQ